MRFSMKNPGYFILLLLPLLLALTGFYLYSVNGPYYLRNIDPEYCYLYNGLCMARLNFIITHLDHPGTPLQVMVAIITRVTHLFNGKDPFVKDVLSNPEYYLKVINYTIIVLSSIVLYSSGLLIFLRTGKIFLSIFIQLSPFISEPQLTIVERVIPESLFVPVIQLLITFLVIFYYTNEQSRIFRYKELILGIICGLSVAVKFTFIPLIIIPVFALSNYKNILKFLLYTVIAFFIFAFPVLFNLNYLFQWLKDLFVYSGKYGEGTPSFLDLETFRINIINIYNQFRFIFYPYILTFISIIIFQLPLLKKRISVLTLRLLYGVFISFSLILFFSAKHYGPHYLIPAMLLVCFNYFLIVEILLEAIKIKNRYPSRALLYSIIAILALIPSFNTFKHYSKLREEKINNRLKTVEFIGHLRDYHAVIISSDGWCSVKELALWFGHLYVNPKYQPEIKKTLNDIYPGRYFHKVSWNTFLNWNDNRNCLNDLLNKHERILVILNRFNQNIRNNFITLLENEPDCEVRCLFKNEQTGEMLFEINNNYE